MANYKSHKDARVTFAIAVHIKRCSKGKIHKSAYHKRQLGAYTCRLLMLYRDSTMLLSNDADRWPMRVSLTRLSPIIRALAAAPRVQKPSACAVLMLRSLSLSLFLFGSDGECACNKVKAFGKLLKIALYTRQNPCSLWRASLSVINSLRFAYKVDDRVVYAGEIKHLYTYNQRGKAVYFIYIICSMHMSAHGAASKSKRRLN